MDTPWILELHTQKRSELASAFVDYAERSGDVGQDRKSKTSQQERR